MNILNRNLLFIAFLGCFSLFAQTKEITVDAIYEGVFYPQQLREFHSMKDGKNYTTLEYNRLKNQIEIVKTDYATQQSKEVFVNSAQLPNNFQFSSYSFDNNQSQLLLGGDFTPIYRHSEEGIYYVYNLQSGVADLLFDKKVQEPYFSPDGTKVAFVFQNNLYVKDLTSKKITQITTDGEKNKIINGITDWVYEEEFAFVRAFDWSSDSQKIAFLRFDEREVPEFSMDVYGSDLYPTQQTFKYPKAGENNSKVSLFVYEVSTKKKQAVTLENDYYIPRIQWTQNPNLLSIQTLNRPQNKLTLSIYDARNQKAKVILTETDKAYVDVDDTLTFLKDDSFLWTSEKDGHNHLYHYNINGKLLHQITKGNWEVTSYYGYHPTEKLVYYQSTEKGSIYRDVYQIGINGKNKKRLSHELGTNNAYFSDDFSYYILNFSNQQNPYRYTLYEAKNQKKIKDLVTNDRLKNIVKEYHIGTKEFSTIDIKGNSLNMYMIKPQNFDANQKYPVLMYQYSGPGSQSVADSWNSANDYWHQMLAQKGYIVVCVDGRGTGYKGRDFKKITQFELGKYETEDQIAVAQSLAKLPYVDAHRIGIWGWSFGGFMSTNCLLKGNDVFKMAIAVAPVTNWRFYDTIYTERYMGVPQENPKGYDDNSPLNFAELLKGKYLLIHGTADDNVHVQNSMRMIEELVQADKEFDWAIYPDKNHGIYGGNTRKQLFKKMTNYILNNL